MIQTLIHSMFRQLIRLLTDRILLEVRRHACLVVWTLHIMLLVLCEKSSIPMEHFTVPLILFIYALTDFLMSQYFLYRDNDSMLFLAYAKPTLVVVFHALLENITFPFGDGCTWLSLSIGVFHLSEAKP